MNAIQSEKIKIVYENSNQKRKYVVLLVTKRENMYL